MKGLLKLLGIGFLLAGLTLPCLAQEPKTITVTAVIPFMEQLNVKLYQIDPGISPWPNDDVWSEPLPEGAPIDFGELEYKSDLGIFHAKYYYAVDIGVVTTASAWTLTHTAGSITGPGGANLDSNINVSFVKCTYNPETHPAPDEEVDIYVPYSQANKSYTQVSLPTKWLRIYYGIATGNTNPEQGPVDASGVQVITTSKPAGSYSGTITLSLTTM
jgi:hypothetical protein